MRDLIALAVLVLLLRIPFANQAVGGDDVYYLAAAYHGLIDPLHPNHTTYIFEGKEVTFQGYPHPPGNAAFLMALLAIFGDVREIPFHLAYALFSLLAVYGVYALARRFSARPLWATLLFLAIPAFVVNGNSFESDIPLCAFLMAGSAAFVYAVDRSSWRLLAVAIVCLAIAAMIAMQSFPFTPILLSYLWTRGKKRTVWPTLVAFTPVAVLVGWQLFERITSGQFPAAVSAAYMSSYGFERVAVKLNNALALSIHALWIVCPILLPFAVREAWRRRKDPDVGFLLLWIGIFLIGAWALFFAGSARYLLPLAAPVALLASFAPLRWIQAGVIVQLCISVSLATVNYQHWNAYRTFAATLKSETEQKSVWIAGEWGLRHYFEAHGALPLRRGQWIPTGDIVVESELAFPTAILHGGRSLVPMASLDVNPAIPLRLIGLRAQSGYSTDSKGFLPFDIRGGVIDRVHAFVLREQTPALSVLPMNAPRADEQIVSGVYPNEGEAWRWMGKDAVLLLKSTGAQAHLELKFYIADAAPARTVSVSVPGQGSVSRTFPGPGSYSIDMPVNATNMPALTVNIGVDRTFRAPGDSRDLGIILNQVALQ